MTRFDPYHIWLGIPSEDQPPSHYRLLGIPELESDADVIDTAAESLSKHEGSLSLDGLTELSDAAAESLSKHKGDLLCLYGLTILSDAAAESLSKHEGTLRLVFNNLPESAAQILRDAGHGDEDDLDDEDWDDD